MADSENTKPFYNSTIPSDWEIVKLKDVAKITSGTTPLRSNLAYHTDGTISWVKTTDLNNNVIAETEEKITALALKETSLRIYPKDTVLVAMYGGFNQIGRTGILGIEAAINQALSAISVKKDDIEPKFLLNWLNAKVGLWKNLAGSSRKDPNITSKDVGDFPFLKVPLVEQKAIAHVLGLMDSVINLNNRLIAQKERRKKWLMQNLLTGKKRLNGFGGEWKSIRFGDVFEYIRSYAISREFLTRLDKSNLIYCIHYGDIHALYEDSFLDFSTQQNIPRIIDNFYPISEKDYLKEGDIILADASEDYEGVGEIVEVVNIDSKTAVGGLHTIVLRGNTEIVAKRFRGYLLSSETVRNLLRKMATGTSVYSVTKTTLNNLSVAIPSSIEEQTAIAQVLQAADKEIRLLKTKTEKLRQQKKGMMQQLLTGKKRLKIENADFS